MNNTLAGINRITEEEEQINYLEDGMVEFTATEQNIEKRMKKKKKKTAWDLCDFKHTNICIIGVSEGEERERKDLRQYLES